MCHFDLHLSFPLLEPHGQRRQLQKQTAGVMHTTDRPLLATETKHDQTQPELPLCTAHRFREPTLPDDLHNTKKVRGGR
jgi:hypothetical protein